MINNDILKPGFYNMDCMEGMRNYPDKYFDLAIVDPPYGINAPTISMGTNKSRTRNGYPSESTADKIRKGRLNKGGGTLKNRILNQSDCRWDRETPPIEYFEELFRVSKNQIIWGANYFALPPTRCVVVWDKLQPWDNFSQVELAWTSFDRPAAMFRRSNTGGRNAEKKIHPTQKPVVLYEWLLNKFSIPGEKILDTHVGSASSLIACYKTGHPYVGFEIDRYYYSLAKERLVSEEAQEVLDLALMMS